MNHKSSILSLVCFLLFVSSNTVAQLVVVQTGPNVSKNTTKNARVAGRVVKLPFFDDFSVTKTDSPDSLLWQAGGGTYISNTATIDHPTINALVFDGVNSKGTPYNYATPTAEGPADSLTSQSVDLSGLFAKDSVYLSFYWRAKGLGEKPDPTDSLKLQLLDSLGKWRTVWSNGGGLLNKTFQDKFINQFISIKDKVYFNKTFQFRFIASGRLSGRFDTWYLDYIYLNKNRVLNKLVQDVACRLPVSSFLKRYSAMPIKQYFAKPATETADSVKTDITNFFNSTNIIDWGFTLTDKLTGSTLQKEIINTNTQIFPFSSQIRKVKVTALPQALAKSKEIVLVAKFDQKTTDGDIASISIPGINLKRNDSISGQTVLSNYYAYDDGTAEYAVYMNKPLGRTAVRFVLNQPDTIVAVQLNINPILKNIDGQSFSILVWDDDNGKPGNILAQKAFKVQYPSTRDGFVTFDFDYGVPVRNTIYVGWLQTSQDPMAIGLDRNNKREGHIFTNTTREWVAYSDTQKDTVSTLSSVFEGSLMLRVVVGSKALPPILATDPTTSDDWSIYPNPTDGVLNWKGDGVQRVEVMGLAGNRILDIHSKQKTLDISALPAGLYLIRLSNRTGDPDKKSLVQKVLKQ